MTLRKRVSNLERQLQRTNDKYQALEVRVRVLELRLNDIQRYYPLPDDGIVPDDGAAK